ncbi:MAG TPA: hypothetical protein VHO90_20330, partial [Bacteroidales bacterium]|nr:hypothetical protein [Bacteroidales bacterium]
MDYSQPSVYIWGVRIDEPVTSLTALMIAAVCLFAFVRLGKLDKSKSVFYLRYYFLIMAAATANGGIIGHAFLSHLSFAWKLIGWILSMVSVMLIERASIEYASKLLPVRISFW